MPRDHSAQETSAFIVYALCFPSEVTVDEARLIYASPSFHRAAALSMANRCSERRYGRTPMLMATMIAASICALSMAIGFIVRRQVTWSPACAGAPASVGAPGRWTSVASGLLKPDRAIAGLVIWLTLLDAALALAAPWPLKVVVDYGVGHRPLPPSLVWAGRLTPVGVAVAAAAAGLLLLLAGAVAGYLVTVLVATVGERMTVRLRGALVEHVLRAQPRAVAAYPLGELTSRLGGDAARVSDTVAAIVDTLVPDAALLAGMTTITAILDWRLTLVVLGIIPLYALTARLRNRALRGAQRQSRARSGELAAFAADLLARLPAVHVFGRAADETGRYNEASSQAARAAVAAVDAGARFIPVNDTLPGLGLAAALVAGTVEVASGRLTIGGLLVFLAYLSSLTGPVRSLARVSGVIARGTASRDRIAELLCLPPLRPVLVTRPPAGTRGRGRGLAISLERVSYAHQPGRPVLTSASLNVPGGSLVCVTGPSGSGKSTLLSLLVRLADPQSGRITVGGRDISGLSPGELRALVSFVPQDPWLHTGTIADNIGYGRRGATRAQILAAAECAGVAAFASGLPDGYDTPVGEHGHQLSGGQQRRVALGRALLRDSPVLLLDEPTTGLDPATESRVIDDLLAATRGRTLILVSHQPGLIARAERVVRVHAGTITEAGRMDLSGSPEGTKSPAAVFPATAGSV